MYVTLTCNLFQNLFQKFLFIFSGDTKLIKNHWDITYSISHLYCQWQETDTSTGQRSSVEEVFSDHLLVQFEIKVVPFLPFNSYYLCGLCTLS